MGPHSIHHTLGFRIQEDSDHANDPKPHSLGGVTAFLLIEQNQICPKFQG